MKIFIALATLTILIGLATAFSIYKKNKNKSRSLMERFKRTNLVKQRLVNGYSNSLMNDPQKNIKTNLFDSYSQLKEKADIHRARLNKYGCSKINGEMLFLDAKGLVYKEIAPGEKLYV